MRVVCVHPARDPLLCGNGPVHFGSAPDDDVVPTGAGAEARHVSIVADARGLVLSVRPGCQRVYVNARPVRERARLRYGDSLTLGANKFLLTTDIGPPQLDASTGTRAASGPVTLRIVSGAASGHTLEVAPELRLGVGTRHFAELGYACRVVLSSEELVFESDSAVPRVNGWHAHRVRLAPGDQIALGEHRLVVEAPGLEYAEHVAALPPLPAPPAEVAPASDDAASTGIWWLIAAAVVLAAVIAFFLYFRW